MSKRLEGKVALVTGGSRGIGRAICETFAHEGAAVIVNFTKNGGAAEEVVGSIVGNGGRAAAMQADVAAKPDIDAMVRTATRQFGPIDILVNNAGILLTSTALKIAEADLDRLIDVNIKGSLYAVQAVAPSMIERRYGKIVNLSSLAGLGTAVPETTPYAMTKAAVISLTKRLAFELGPHGINVNAIAPGFIRTEMLQSIDNEENRARMDALSKRAVLNRIGLPSDIASAALFLASDESSFMTAQVLTVDGGRMDFLTHSG